MGRNAAKRLAEVRESCQDSDADRAATRFVAGESSAVDETHSGAAERETTGCCSAGGTSADHEDVGAKKNREYRIPNTECSELGNP